MGRQPIGRRASHHATTDDNHIVTALHPAPTRPPETQVPPIPSTCATSHGTAPPVKRGSGKLHRHWPTPVRGTNRLPGALTGELPFPRRYGDLSERKGCPTR